MFYGIKSYETCSNAVYQYLTQAHNHVATRAEDTLFEDSSEICCSGVS